MGLEEEYIKLENFRELADKAYDKIATLEKMFFDPDDFKMWEARWILGCTIRKMAMSFHMSRYNIRKRLNRTQKRLEALRKLMSI